MRLKSLELHGFKSFPDKTLINFDQGMTVIVGPNGSGKSNISDAMRWVLGETSQKSIRSTKSEDVIFDGSSSRSPMSYCEVSLIIDNTGDGGKLPVDYDEVEITRRYYRSGDSEYMINRKACRLRDIHELFMNTGVGKTGYSIVSQGKVADILSQKSDERRSVFEEAAGISKYRHKKNESERHLESTRENLVRLKDILSELQSRVGPLEKESEKAKKYLEIYEQKKQVDVSLWLYDVKDLADKLEKCEKDFVLSKNELSIIEEAVSALESRSERLVEKSQKNRLQYEQNENDIREATEKKHSFESSAEIGRTELSHTGELIAQYSAELISAKKEKDEAENKLSQSREELARVSEKTSAAEKEREEADVSLDEAGVALSLKEEELSKLDSEIKNKENSLVEARLSLSSISGTKSSEDSRVKELYEQNSALSEDIALLKDRLASSEKTIEAYGKKCGEASEKAEAAEKKAKEKSELLKELNYSLSEIKVQIASIRQRVEVLTRMEEHFEGYINSVRFVMENAQDGTLSGIYGPVSKLISVESRYATAIETALGNNLQNIAVKDEEAAKRAIRLLKEKNAGRCTFYPLSAIRPNEADAGKYKNDAGYVGLASELVKTDREFDTLVKYLLGRTLVFTDLDSASVCAKKNGYPIKMVTLDGQVINAGGSYTGGSAKRDSGILTRSSEIAKLKTELDKRLAEEAAKAKEIDVLNAEISALSSEYDSANGNISLLTSLINAEKTQYGILSAQAESEEKTLGNVKKDIERYEKSGEYFTSEEKRINENVANLEEELSVLLSKRETLNGSIREMASELEILRKTNSEKIVAYAESKKDFEALTREVEAAENAVVSAAARIGETEELLASLKEKQEKIRERLDRDLSMLEGAEQAVLALDKAKEEFQKKTDEYEKETYDLRQQLKDKNAEHETVFRSYTQLESRLETLKNERDKAGERIWEEYELSYNSAKELGYPEVTKENRKEYASMLADYKSRIKSLGNVNVGAIEEYKEVKERYDFMSTQIADLENSEKSLLGVISKLEKEMREKFTQAMADINYHFKLIFRDLFDGGDAELTLTDPDDVLSSGIDISVTPPGKIIKNLVSLSGGEQAFVAIALFFAILKVNPTPFCIFDEIESALDEVNVVRFAEYAKTRFADSTQFVMITHRRGTMEAADTLYGVSMYEKGISKVLTVNVREIEDKLGMKLN